ncbi:tRNA (adenine(22)-N(1))-methyltransferase TrmK [Caldifermentibacillus hisashii]|uniref:tRNA (adenine(22)-N(1))-methyltransferase n=1 Tax=Caldifermentibacillus hisashii TaxID=996558 RepID=UPI0031FCE80F
MIKLAERLKEITTYIPKDSILADIGSDHAYLPIYCVKNKIVKKAIAGEVADGPLLAAKSSVKAYQFEQFIDVRKGDGLAVLKETDSVDCITIAGMGGALISSILDNGKEKLHQVSRLILQPNLAADQIRLWLLNHNWKLVKEKILEEDGHIYEILVAEQGESEAPYCNDEDKEKQVFFGPYLIKEKNHVFYKKWKREYNEWLRVLEKLDKAKENAAIIRKKSELKKYIQWYKEVFPDENTERA